MFTLHSVEISEYICQPQNYRPRQQNAYWWKIKLSMSYRVGRGLVSKLRSKRPNSSLRLLKLLLSVVIKLLWIDYCCNAIIKWLWYFSYFPSVPILGIQATKQNTGQSVFCKFFPLESDGVRRHPTAKWLSSREFPFMIYEQGGNSENSKIAAFWGTLSLSRPLEGGKNMITAKLLQNGWLSSVEAR